MALSYPATAINPTSSLLSLIIAFLTILDSTSWSVSIIFIFWFYYLLYYRRVFSVSNFRFHLSCITTLHTFILNSFPQYLLNFTALCCFSYSVFLFVYYHCVFYFVFQIYISNFCSQLHVTFHCCAQSSLCANKNFLLTYLLSTEWQCWQSTNLRATCLTNSASSSDLWMAACSSCVNSRGWHCTAAFLGYFQLVCTATSTSSGTAYTDTIIPTSTSLQRLLSKQSNDIVPMAMCSRLQDPKQLNFVVRLLFMPL